MTRNNTYGTYRSPKRSTGDDIGCLGVILVFLGVLALGLIFSVIGALITGFLVMIGVGILHSLVPAVPAFGYWACVVAMFILGVITSVIRGGASASKS